MGQALGEFVDWTDWPELTRSLVSRGFSDEEIRGFLGSNWLNFMRRSGV
jgi:microsomal dipeptidase-like Zn-dependent dipeptidase